MRDSTRFFDILISALLVVVFAPLCLVIAVIIKITSRGPIIYVQKRVGRNNIDFDIYKFRTMRLNADKYGYLTVGGRDKRITRVGYYLRKCKLDELPQLFNVLKGDMSLVGPRPELRKYVNMYTPAQMFVLTIRPGITDYASITYRNENELLLSNQNPEDYYIRVIMPHKIELNKHYIYNKTLKNYFIVIFTTVLTVFNPQVYFDLTKSK
jgi:lipopolysaccharide/colanic/teichoic acid biosynthesis glycosyltransferase